MYFFQLCDNFRNKFKKLVFTGIYPYYNKNFVISLLRPIKELIRVWL